MKTKYLKFYEETGGTEGSVREARLVYKKDAEPRPTEAPDAKRGGAPKKPEPAAEIGANAETREAAREKARQALIASKKMERALICNPSKKSCNNLRNEVLQPIKKEAEEIAGEKIEPDKWNTDKIEETISKIFMEWTGSFNSLFAFFATLGKNIGEMDEYKADTIPPAIPEGQEVDKELPELPEEKAQREQGLKGEKIEKTISSGKNYQRAERVSKQLSLHPDWKTYIARGSEKWSIPFSVYATFIDFESGYNPNSAPIYKDKVGHKVKGRFSQKEISDRGLKLVTSAHGLAQAMGNSAKSYIKERYAAFRQESGNSSLPAVADPKEIMYNPEVAIDFFGWHINKKIQEANRAVRKLGLPDSYRLNASSDPKWLYMAYNNGGKGYALLRGYTDNPPRIRHDQLCAFQRDETIYKGRKMEGWEARNTYAARVGEATKYFEFVSKSA